jgi:hypothetical protein
MTRKAEAIFGINTEQGPYEVFVAALDATGQMTFVMENDDELTRFLSNTQPAITCTFAQGAGSTATSIGFTITKGAYTTAVIDRGGDHVSISVDISAIANTTDAGSTAGYAPIKWSLQNAVVSGTYQ